MAPRLSDFVGEERLLKVTVAKGQKPEIIEKPSKDTWALGRLAYFLNLDLDSVPSEERRPYLCEWWFGVDDSFEPRTWSKAKKLQKAIREDILPIIEKRRYVFSSQHGYDVSPLRLLIEKINRMTLRFSWDVSWVNPQQWSRRHVRDKDTGKMTYDLEEYPEPIIRRQNQPLLHLGRSRCYVIRCSPCDSAQGFFYGIIIEALEDGSFSRLSKCGHCQKLFFAKRLGEKYDRDCGKIVDTLKAPKRMKRLRNKQEKEAEATGLPKLSKLATSGLKTIREVFGEELDEFLPFAEKIREGHSAHKIWRQLPPRFKKAIAETAI